MHHSRKHASARKSGAQANGSTRASGEADEEAMSGAGYQQQRRENSMRDSTKRSVPSERNALHGMAASDGTKAPCQRRPSPPSAPATQKDPSHDWNGSTQIPATISKPLKHQILNRNYQPPAPVFVDPSDAIHLLKRLSKTTISSRLKRHPADQAMRGALAGVTLPISGKRAHKQQLERHKSSNHDGQHNSDETQTSPPDSRARDGVQTLLMYRQEVEKRLSLDPTYYSRTG